MLDPLVSLLRSESCKPLLGRLRKRAERGKPFTGTLQLPGLSEAERQAVADLTGQTSRGGRVSINVAAFEQLIRNTGRFASLLRLIEAAVGDSIENKRAVHERHAAEWRQLWEWAASRAENDSARQRWLNELRQTGWLKARSRRDHHVAMQMLTTAFELLEQLPCRGIPLPVFAACHLNDAHALDLNRDLSRLVCRGIAATQNLATPVKRSELRRTWESVGIVPDELSVTVLALNLPVIGDSLTDHVLRAHAKLGEPCRLTFRQLRVSAPTIQTANQSPLFVCENPSIVASAADRLGSKCQPLICVEGQPNLAAYKLLQMAMSRGWKIFYHGDFDWGGIRIANWIYKHLGFSPWRFDASHYRGFPRKHRKLIPPKSAALWDPELSAAMTSDGHVGEEEQVIEQLVQDLSLECGDCP